MVARKKPNVKPCEGCGRVHAYPGSEFLCWLDRNPRYGWLWALVLLLNTILNLLDVTGFGAH